MVFHIPVSDSFKGHCELVMLIVDDQCCSDTVTLSLVVVSLFLLRLQWGLHLFSSHHKYPIVTQEKSQGAERSGQGSLSRVQ